MSTYQLKSLNQHCFDLAHLFFILKQTRSEKYAEQNYAHWLHLASGINRIELDHSKVQTLDQSSIDLSATLFEHASGSNSHIVRSLVIFNLIWHTFKTLLYAHFKDNDGSALGKACAYLDAVYNPYKNLVKYNDLVHDLKKLIKKSPLVNSREILRHTNQNLRSSIGILLVDRVNDYFAHCAYQFPLGSDPAGGEAINPEMIDRSSRIVLLTIQMLMLPWFEQHPQDQIKIWWYSQEKRRRMHVYAFLRTVHLQLI